VSSWRELKLEGSVLMVREIRLNVLPAEFDMDSSAEKVCRLERRSAAEDKLRGLGDEARQAFRMYSYAAFTYVWPRRGCLLPEAMGRLLRHLIAPAPRGPDPIRCDRPRHFARPPACLTARREPAGIPRRRIRGGSRYWKNGSVNTASAPLASVRMGGHRIQPLEADSHGHVGSPMRRFDVPCWRSRLPMKLAR